MVIIITKIMDGDDVYGDNYYNDANADDGYVVTTTVYLMLALFSISSFTISHSNN